MLHFSMTEHVVRAKKVGLTFTLFLKCSGGRGGGGKWRFEFVEGRGHALFLVVIGLTGLIPKGRQKNLEGRENALPSP